MLAFIFIVCNGNIGPIQEITKGSTLTRHEEWFFFFEKIGAEQTANGLIHLSRKMGLGSNLKPLLMSLTTRLDVFFPVLRAGLSLQHMKKTKNIQVMI